MDYKIIAPNKNYTGESAGVNFINGEGIAKGGKSVDWFRQKGYEVEEIIESREPETPETPEELKEKQPKGKPKGKTEEEKEIEPEGSDAK